LGTTTLPTIQDRVAKGAELLDTHEPGWARWVNPHLLDQADEVFCVLGQLHGSYEAGRSEYYHLLGGELDEVAHGFVVASSDGAWEAAHDTLTDCWRQAVTARRATTVSSNNS
jgi:hypothetical protein